MSDGIATTTAPGADRRESEDWWRTSIIEMSPGVIRYRGYPIEELIARRVSLAQMIWLMTRGELPSKAQGALLEAALMSAVDHGPQAPSIAIARMAATCGVGLNSAMASAVNVLGDVHGGAAFIDFPENVAEMKVDKAPIKVQKAYTSDAPARKVSEAAMLISNAKAPVILAGNGVIRQGAADALVTFSEALRIPVANTFMAKGVMPFTNELSLGTIRPQGTRPALVRL